MVKFIEWKILVRKQKNMQLLANNNVDFTKKNKH